MEALVIYCCMGKKENPIFRDIAIGLCEKKTKSNLMGHNKLFQ